MAAAPAPAVSVGLEELEAGRGPDLRGRRLGLLAHAASVTADGRHAIAVLRGLGLDLRRLYAPEHGVRGDAAAGDRIPDGRDPHSGLPVLSLYGSKSVPAARDLAGIDVLVVDLQDVGVRFYTYVSTLLGCLEAAGAVGVEVLVLDRPNPLGGELVEGPLREPGFPESLLSRAPGPLVHGLTLGEIARLANARLSRPARLRVVPLRGWRRSMRWTDTGRPWVPPSPNLRSAEAALAYPGTCLLEGTTVSEGRGSEAPFLLLGAPGLPTEALVAGVAVTGYRLTATTFVPIPSAAAAHPRYEGETCRGVRVHITDASATRPYRLGLSLLAALRGAGWLRWRDQGRAFDTLVGGRELRRGLDRGEGLDRLEGADEPGIADFRRTREEFLLYR